VITVWPTAAIMSESSQRGLSRQATAIWGYATSSFSDGHLVNEWSIPPLLCPLMRKYSHYFRIPLQLELLVLAALIVIPCQTRADDLSEKDRFFLQLSAPMTSIVDGLSFRDGIRRIADQAEVNLWIDRGVDPTAPIIAAGPVGPTVFAAIQKLADGRDCVVMPVSGVMLVGKPQWVDQTAASILQLEGSGKQQLADVAWDDLATPAEAFAQAVSTKRGAANMNPPLPHDLWPATSWKQIDERVAVTLVLAQFGLKPQSTANMNALKPVAASATGRFKRRYSQGKADAAIRNAMHQFDRNSRVSTRQGWIEATASVAAHRKATAAMVDQFAVSRGPDPDKDTFTLKRLSTTAENVLTLLARTAQRTCVIQPEANELCKTIITVEAVDVSLRKLVDMVADQAGVVAEWQDNKIVISAKE
jgi:hypothetical protein